MDVPPLITEYYNSFSLLTSLNMNFTFMSPLSYAASSFSVERNQKYVDFGFSTSSFLYNMESQMLSIALTILFIVMFHQVFRRCKNNRMRLFRSISKYANNLYNSKMGTYIDMYYQSRLNMFICAFHHLDSNAIIFKGKLQIISLAILVIVMAMDGFIVLFWVSKLLSGKEKYTSMAGFSLYKSNVSSYRFTGGMIVLQPVIAFIIVLLKDVPHMQIYGVVGIMAIMSMVIILCTHMVQVKIRISYLLNNMCMIVYCISWLLYCSYKQQWFLEMAMLVALNIPILSALVMFVPWQVKDVILAIKAKLCKRAHPL